MNEPLKQLNIWIVIVLTSFVCQCGVYVGNPSKAKAQAKGVEFG